MSSAHWETEALFVSGGSGGRTVHDYFGFPAELNALRYPAPNAPEAASRAFDLLADAGLRPITVQHRGLDHGAWVPLLLMFPEADVPVFQVSVQTHLGPPGALALGRALGPLRDRVLVVGSGSLTHDLSEFHPSLGEDRREPGFVGQFADWLDERLAVPAVEQLLRYRDLAPFARRNHPTEEHLLPIFVALGAGLAGDRRVRIHDGTMHGVIRMDAYAFGGPEVDVLLERLHSIQEDAAERTAGSPALR